MNEEANTVYWTDTHGGVQLQRLEKPMDNSTYITL
jgi:hypothetical protein